MIYTRKQPRKIAVKFRDDAKAYSFFLAENGGGSCLFYEHSHVQGQEAQLRELSRLVYARDRTLPCGTLS